MNESQDPLRKYSKIPTHPFHQKTKPPSSPLKADFPGSICVQHAVGRLSADRFS